MSSLCPAIETLTAPYLIRLFGNILHDRVCLSDAELVVLDSTVVEFLTRNELAMIAIINDEALVAKHPDFVRKLLIMARVRSKTPAERIRIEELAVRAGFDDLFHPA